MNWSELLVGALIGLVLAEWSEVCPWLSRRMVPPAARLWTIRNPERREVYEEEWLAVIDERPGKLLKLITALSFLGAGTWRFGRYRLASLAIRGAIAFSRKFPVYAAALDVLGTRLRRMSRRSLTAMLTVLGATSALTFWMTTSSPQFPWRVYGIAVLVTLVLYPVMLYAFGWLVLRERARRERDHRSGEQ